MMDGVCCGPGYASPAEAIKAPREKLLYTIAIYTGTGIQKPDYLATVDADPTARPIHKSSTGWKCPALAMNCITWAGTPVLLSRRCGYGRKYLLVPGVRSNNIHVIDTATDPFAPRLHKVIDGAEIKSKTNLSGPHTVHCLGSEIIISFLGDAQGEAPGGYLHLNKDFEIQGVGKTQWATSRSL